MYIRHVDGDVSGNSEAAHEYTEADNGSDLVLYVFIYQSGKSATRLTFIWSEATRSNQ